MAAKWSKIVAVLGVLSLIIVVAKANEEALERSGAAAAGRRLRPAEDSRDDLESIDLLLVLLFRIAAASLAASLALPVAVPLLVELISGLFN